MKLELRLLSEDWIIVLVENSRVEEICIFGRFLSSVKKAVNCIMRHIMPELTQTLHSSELQISTRERGEKSAVAFELVNGTNRAFTYLEGLVRQRSVILRMIDQRFKVHRRRNNLARSFRVFHREVDWKPTVLFSPHNYRRYSLFLIARISRDQLMRLSLFDLFSYSHWRSSWFFLRYSTMDIFFLLRQPAL